jgi:prolyl oligopeptidase
MLSTFVVLSGILALAVYAGSQEKLTYPVAKKVAQVDDYHGTKVADPYRWLEDPDSPDSRAWIDAENKLTFSYLEQIPERKAIKDRLTELWNYERFTAPEQESGRYFFTRNTGLQNQNVVYWLDKLNGEPKMLLDPNTFSADGTVALTSTSASNNGKLFLYGSSASGSDWQEFRVRDVDSGKDLPDVIRWVKFSSASWMHDDKGFFYSRYDEPKAGSILRDTNYFQKLYFHRLGTLQSEDVLVYERPDAKEMQFGGQVTEDGHYLVITVFQGTDPRNRLYYKDLTRKGASVVKLLDDFDASYQFIGNDGPVFWIMTNLDAPRQRLIEVDTRHPERANWKPLIPESKDKLESLSVINDKFIGVYLKDAHSDVRVHDLSGKFLSNVDLPGIGTVEGFAGKRTDKETFYSYTSFTTPVSIYRYDAVTGESSPFRSPKLSFNPADYETEQVMYASKDGTRAPLFITHKKGIKLDGQNPTLLYGYGGFNVNITPEFRVSRIVWMEMGGVYAQAVLRGGGEYGEQWHQAGTKLHKQNVFDDFIAAAEWLQKNNYSSPAKLAIQGGSNGGLLIGASITQRPDLFGAALPAVGVMDMLRFHKFTIGWAWTSDYGSSDDAEQFKAIYAYSPLHNLKPGTKYPPTLITTADHDDRVVPAHSFKFAATMQADQAGDAPVLIRIETKAGHGAGKPVTKMIEEVTDQWAFLVRNLNMRPTLASK